MKKRWLCLLIENEIGSLARISGLFSAKSYHLNSLSIGVAEDETIYRMTISLFSEDQLFEQIKKQLSRAIEVIEVIDYTDGPIHTKEIMFLRVVNYSEIDKIELFRFAQVFNIKVIAFNSTMILLESVQSEDENNTLIQLLNEKFRNQVEIIRGGSVAVEAV